VFAEPGAIRLQAARAQGPGGQNVNKVNTRMEMWLDLRQVTGLRETALARLAKMAGKRLTQDGLLHLTCGEHRSQETNRQELFDRLRLMIQTARIEPKSAVKPSLPTDPSSAAWNKKTAAAKSNRGGGVKLVIDEW